MPLSLSATKRTIKGRRTNDLRVAAQIPAVVYGHGFPSDPITLPLRDFTHVYRSAGASTLVDLVVDGTAPMKVLIHDVAFDARSGAVEHVDLYRVQLTEKIHAEIPLHFVGDAPAVKELGGILVKNLNKIKVTCLPTDLVTAIEVPITALKVLDQSLAVRDLVIPAGITVLDQPGEVIVTVTPPRAEEEAPAAAEAEKVADVKVVGKEKKEGEEGASAEDEKAPEAKGKDKKKT
ncbi:50S ribosomal protein L25 [Candidatus Uhrbacteria bacterium]|nr:50S ribosomal protein L25 [Candidatus Uhrbacteria bacterium]